MNTYLKNAAPHLLVLLFFVVITLVYFSPVLQGKVVQQHDIHQWEGMSKEIVDFRAQYHTEPLWTNSMFSGMPAYQISVLYPANLLSYVNKLLLLGIPEPFGYVFIALLSFYVLLLAMKIDYRIAAVGAIAYAFASYNFTLIPAGHNSKLHAISLAPFVLAGIMMVFSKRYLFGGAVTALGLGLQIYANHLQITYYLAIVIGILLLVEAIRYAKEGAWNHLFKSAAVLGIAAILAVLPNITSLWATYEYGKDSTRGPSELTSKKHSDGLDKDYALAWSYGVGETMTLLIPDFMGGPSQTSLDKNSATYKTLVENGAGAQANQIIRSVPLYWGPQSFTAGPTYFGAIVIFLFVIGAFLMKGEKRIWLIGGAVLFTMLAWGRHFTLVTDFFFSYFPAYNKFRTVAMSLTAACLLVSILAMVGLNLFLNGAIDDRKKKKVLLYSYYALGGICLLFALMPGAFFDFSSDVDENFKQYDWLIAAIRDDRAHALQSDAFRSLIFISATFALLWFGLKKKISYMWVTLGIGALVLVDLWAVDKRYMNNDQFVSEARAKQSFQPTAADQMILQDKDPGYRVMNTAVSTFNDATTSYFHHSIGGYHGAKLKRYQELIENQISENNMAVLDMLNTRYIILNSKETGEPFAQRNPGALGAAWFVQEYKYVANADSEMAALSTFNPAQTAVVDERFKERLGEFRIDFDSTATIRLVDYKPNDLVYESECASEQLAVFSEIYYSKGWKAYVDGNLTPHFRVNYVLRAMKVPAGKHRIEFKFEPNVYYTGEKISLAGSILLLLLLAGSGWVELRAAMRAKN